MRQFTRGYHQGEVALDRVRVHARVEAVGKLSRRRARDTGAH